jgi:NADH-quinone oxidoreductase subunit L
MTTVLGAALPLVPLLFALIGFVTPQRSRETGAALGVAGSLLALLIAIALAVTVDGTVQAGFTVAEFGSLPITASLLLTPAAAYVAVAVGAVALAVQVYSISYLRDDERYGPYAAQIGLFTGAMLTVVVAGDLIMLLVGWEVMGICSYLLIGHDRRLPEAPAAAVKAFLVTRVGDVGFLLAIVLLALHSGSFRLVDVLAPGPTGLGGLSPAMTTGICLLLLAGVAGKSAQFPLHTWLPDAMAGPTPISALIHAATMVAAGIYVVTRTYPLFLASQTALWVLAVMSVITMLLGALVAVAADDIKRVLAWSTVSQIAYMAAALALGSIESSTASALFYLLCHAAFKALLFLCAGAVIHAVGTNLMSGMGGLRRGMPVTFWCMTIGLGALIGIPPLSGFWGKDEILYLASQSFGGRALMIYLIGLITVFVTAVYATLLWLRTFFGRAAGAAHPHEPPAAMAWPVVALALPSALFGFAGLSETFVHALGAPEGESFAPHAAALAPLPFALLGIGTAWVMWRRDAAEPARAVGALRPVLVNAFYLDAVQHAVVARPALALASLVRRADETIVDGAVESTGRGTLELGGVVGAAHRSGLPRALTAVLGGAAVLGVAAFVIVGGWR